MSDYSDIAETLEGISECLEALGEYIGNMINTIGETTGDCIEVITKLLNEKDLSYPKTKYKPVKSLLKHYKEPFIRVRYHARSKLRGRKQ